jgi:hypothetical protein
MTTFNQMIEEVLINLEGFTLRQDRTTYLTAAITNSDLSIALASGDNIGKGIVEIDDELIHIDSVDRSDRSAVISPFGRGYRGSTAAAHTINTKVTFAPSLPRLSVKRAINDTLLAVYPSIFGVASTTFTYNSSITTYALPAEAETVLSISWDSIGPSGEWIPIRRWRQDPTAATADYATTNTVSIYDNIVPGRTVQVIYSKQPTAFSTTADVFTTVTGLTESARDVIVYGAAYRMVSFIDPGRLSFTSPEADANDVTRQFGSGTNTARYLLALYQQRLQEESTRINGKYPVRVHYTI